MRGRNTTWRRFRYTPLRDLLRARVTGRLDARRVIAEAGLGEALEGLAWDVVRRTRLRLLEKADVARELCGHFADALAAGERAETVAAAFGDARLAARLIRRAKKRARGPVWKATVWTGRGVGAVLLLAAVWYAWAAAVYFGGTPRVRVDYLARVNAPALATPEDERAWPEYRAAWLAIPAEILARNPDEAEDIYGARPGDEAWARAVAAVGAFRIRSSVCAARRAVQCSDLCSVEAKTRRSSSTSRQFKTSTRSARAAVRSRRWRRVPAPRRH